MIGLIELINNLFRQLVIVIRQHLKKGLYSMQKAL